MKLGTLRFMCLSLALFIGGCPKRQAPWRIVFVPTQAPAPVQTADAPAQSMVIEEPSPPEPTPAPASDETAAPTPPRRQRRVMRTASPAAGSESEPAGPQPSAPVPSLEPRATYAEEAALRRQIQSLQDDVRQRIAKLSGAGLSGADRKTLDDARTFFAQSSAAMNEGDLQRALNLARKASLLVLAIEK